jgi:hypothetical protein
MKLTSYLLTLILPDLSTDQAFAVLLIVILTARAVVAMLLRSSEDIYRSISSAFNVRLNNNNYWNGLVKYE